MLSEIEKWIFNLSLLVLFFVVVIGLFSEPRLTGFITSDGSWKSPASDNDYQSPKSDNSYESPTTGPGYIAPKIDESWEPPKEGPGFLKPEIGPGFEKPIIGEGFQKPGAYNVSFNESGEKVIKRILELPKTNISRIELKKDEDKKSQILSQRGQLIRHLSAAGRFMESRIITKREAPSLFPPQLPR